VHDLQWLCGVSWSLPLGPAPCVIVSASGFHSVNALIGPANQWRQESQ
jgi:hypothetical protein